MCICSALNRAHHCLVHVIYKTVFQSRSCLISNHFNVGVFMTEEQHVCMYVYIYKCMYIDDSIDIILNLLHVNTKANKYTSKYKSLIV